MTNDSTSYLGHYMIFFLGGVEPRRTKAEEVRYTINLRKYRMRCVFKLHAIHLLRHRSRRHISLVRYILQFPKAESTCIAVPEILHLKPTSLSEIVRCLVCEG